MEVPLSIILKTELFANSTVVAGKSGLDRDVTSINIIDGAYGYKYSKEKMLVLCSAYSIAASSEKQIDLIEQISSRGAVGIAFKSVYFPDSRIPESMLIRADELGIPLIELDSNCPSYANFITFFANSVYLSGLQSIMSKNELLKLLIRTMNKTGLPGLAEKISVLLEKNVSILFEDEHYVYPCNNETMEFCRTISDLSAYCLFPASPRFAGMHCLLIEEGGESPAPDPNKLAAAVRSGKNTITYIWVYSNKAACCDNDALVLDAAALACELEIAQILTYQQQEAQRKLLFVERLLTGKISSMHEAMLMTRGLQWRIPLETRIMVTACESGNIFCQEIEMELNNLFRNLQKNIIVFPYKGDITIFLPHSHGSHSSACEDIAQAMELKFGKGSLRFGVGREASLQTIHKSYSQAIFALQTGRRLFPNDRVHEFEKLGAFRLNCAEALPAEIRLFCEDYIVPLVEEDLKTKMGLLKTLEVFFACSTNYSRAGSILHLHPNTVRYRIETIGKICGVNFDDPSDVLNMQIALKLLPLAGL